IKIVCSAEDEISTYRYRIIGAQGNGGATGIIDRATADGESPGANRARVINVKLGRCPSYSEDCPSGISIGAVERNSSTSIQAQGNGVGAGHYSIYYQRSAARLGESLRRTTSRTENDGSVDRVRPAGVGRVDRAGRARAGVSQGEFDARTGTSEIISGRRGRREVQPSYGERCAQVCVGY